MSKVKCEGSGTTNYQYFNQSELSALCGGCNTRVGVNSANWRLYPHKIKVKARRRHYAR